MVQRTRKHWSRPLDTGSGRSRRSDNIRGGKTIWENVFPPLFMLYRKKDRKKIKKYIDNYLTSGIIQTELIVKKISKND